MRANFIVRTRADADLEEPRAGERGRLETALASGAQIVATDYPVEVEGIDYVVAIPDGSPSRCTPGVAPATCTSAAVEDPGVLASTRR